MSRRNELDESWLRGDENGAMGDISQEQNGRGLAGQKMCLESEHGQPQ